ncbi:MAG: sigma-70 family RNA polymerase sigma factor, partial [Actinobacteria bacterium]|nr:sigma-70 family RNA polymerase sigma factor [Actinomycetota bacterium]
MSLKRETGFDGYERDGDHGPDDPARAATLRLIERHGAQVMRTARRYSVTAEDAEDAYQRAVEIMLTKAPDIPDAELLPWLKTVVKHEAFAIRRQEGCSPLGVDGSLDGASEAEASIAAPVPSPIEQTERFERLRLGAEAMRHLKPQEIRAMTLLAEGYSYRQICDETGWTYTKVNRRVP